MKLSDEKVSEIVQNYFEEAGTSAFDDGDINTFEMKTALDDDVQKAIDKYEKAAAERSASLVKKIWKDALTHLLSEIHISVFPDSTHGVVAQVYWTETDSDVSTTYITELGPVDFDSKGDVDKCIEIFGQKARAAAYYPPTT